MRNIPNDITITNAQRQKYASLSQAKHRRQLGLFMAQGTKCVLDTLRHFKIETLLCTVDWCEKHHSDLHDLPSTQVKKSDINKITTLTTSPDVIAIYHIPDYAMPDLNHSLALALDCVQDPGNLGTIIRVADWMGVTDIIASRDTADVWAPKVVQASMGAISRVRVYYVDLPEFLEKNKQLNTYGTFLDGKDIYKQNLSSTGLIIMGNEGNGISAEVAKHVKNRLLIPSYPPDRPTSESLNVAIATAITLSEFRRNG